MDKRIVELTVKYADSSTAFIYLLTEPLTEKSKTELREVTAELQKLVKDKHVSVAFGHTNYGKNKPVGR